MDNPVNLPNNPVVYTFLNQSAVQPSLWWLCCISLLCGQWRPYITTGRKRRTMKSREGYTSVWQISTIPFQKSKPPRLCPSLQGFFFLQCICCFYYRRLSLWCLIKIIARAVARDEMIIGVMIDRNKISQSVVLFQNLNILITVWLRCFEKLTVNAAHHKLATVSRMQVQDHWGFRCKTW